MAKRKKVPKYKSAVKASNGRYGDTRLIHANPREEALLLALGGAGTKNPSDGAPEYYSDSSHEHGADSDHDRPGGGGIAGGGGDSRGNGGNGGFGAGPGGSGNENAASGVTGHDYSGSIGPAGDYGGGDSNGAVINRALRNVSSATVDADMRAKLAAANVDPHQNVGYQSGHQPTGLQNAVRVGMNLLGLGHYNPNAIGVMGDDGTVQQVRDAGSFDPIGLGLKAASLVSPIGSLLNTAYGGLGLFGIHGPQVGVANLDSGTSVPGTVDTTAGNVAMGTSSDSSTYATAPNSKPSPLATTAAVSPVHFAGSTGPVSPAGYSRSENDYGDDITHYGQHPEWNWYTVNSMAEGGKVDYDDPRADEGEYSDSLMAHVSPGEMWLPKEFYSMHPDLLAAIVSRMQAHGMDPREYIVGMDQNKNPNTGLGQHSFWKTLGNIAKTVAPVVVGGLTSSATGSPLAGGLVSGGLSKLLGGSWGQAIGEGALTGLGSSALGLGSGGGWFSSPAITGTESATAAEHLLDSGGSSGSSGGGFLSSLFGGGSGGSSGVGDWISKNPLAVGVGALTLANALSNQKPQTYGPKAANTTDSYKPDLNIQLDRKKSDNPQPNWYIYGQLPESSGYQWYDNNGIATVPGMAKGGKAPAGALSQIPMIAPQPGMGYSGPVNGPGGGQDDTAMLTRLASGEHVLDADTVSNIGDGSNDEGHRKIEQMKTNLRKHKRSASPKSIPPKAKPIEDYING